MTLLDRLIRLLTDENPDEGPGGDIHEVCAELAAALIDGADLGLVPELEEHLESFLARKDFYGRDVIGEVLAGIAGPDALPVLLRASARDLDDDQDTFAMVISDLLEEHPERSRPAVLDLVGSDDPALRATGVWALDFVAGGGDTA